MHGMHADARFDDLDLGRSQWVGKDEQSVLNYFFTIKQATTIKFATTVGHFFYMTLSLKTCIWLDRLAWVSPQWGTAD